MSALSWKAGIKSIYEYLRIFTELRNQLSAGPCYCLTPSWFRHPEKWKKNPEILKNGQKVKATIQESNWPKQGWLDNFV